MGLFLATSSQISLDQLQITLKSEKCHHSSTTVSVQQTSILAKAQMSFNNYKCQ